jgi:hypothetical protein
VDDALAAMGAPAMRGQPSRQAPGRPPAPPDGAPRHQPMAPACGSRPGWPAAAITEDGLHPQGASFRSRTARREPSLVAAKVAS